MSSRRVPTLLAPLVLAVLLAGCDDDPGAPAPTPEPTPSSSEPAPDPTTPTSEPPASEPTEPAVAGATGPELRMDAASLRMPEGWEVDANQASFLASGNGGDVVSGNISLSQLPSLDPGAPLTTLEDATNDSRFGGKGEVLDRVEVGGVEMVHVRGRSGMQYDEEYAAVVGGDIVGVAFSLPFAFDTAERDELVASVLATLTFS